MSIHGLVLRVEMLKRIKRSNCPWKQAVYTCFQGWRWWLCWWGTSTLENEHTQLVFKGGDGGVEKEQLPSKTSIDGLFSRVLSISLPCELHEAKVVFFSKTSLLFSAILDLFWSSILSVNFKLKIEGNGGELTELYYRLYSPVWAAWGLVLRSEQVHFQWSWAHFEGLFWVSISSLKLREMMENSLSYATSNKEALSLEFFLQANLHWWV